MPKVHQGRRKKDYNARAVGSNVKKEGTSTNGLPIHLAFIIIVTVLSCVTFARNTVWKDPITLWENVARKSPEKERAYSNLGYTYKKKRWFAKAIEMYSKAIRLNPSNYLTYSNRGSAYNELGQLDRAVEDLNRAISLDPLQCDSYYNRAIVLEKMGRDKEAFADFDKAINLSPSYFEAYNNRGALYGKTHVFAKAIDDFSRSIAIHPTAAAYANRSRTYAMMNQNEAALADHNRSLELQ